MNKLVIPSILLATVMVAGMFAFAPVEQASTVHDTVILQAGLNFSEATSDTEDLDALITCSATGDGCLIMEIVVTERESLNLDIGTITATINGEDEVYDPAGATLNNESKGLAFSDYFFWIPLTPGDTIAIQVVDGSSSSTDYTFVAFGQGDFTTTIVTP